MFESLIRFSELTTSKSISPSPDKPSLNILQLDKLSSDIFSNPLDDKKAFVWISSKFLSKLKPVSFAPSKQCEPNTVTSFKNETFSRDEQFKNA